MKWQSTDSIMQNHLITNTDVETIGCNYHNKFNRIKSNRFDKNIK